METALAAMVLLVAGVFLAFAHNIGNVAPVKGWQVQAKFNSIDGLAVGNDVRIGGVKIGTVVELGFEPARRQILAKFEVETRYSIPTDSTATIVADGLLGGAHLRIEPGAAPDTMVSRGEIVNTRDSLDIASLVGRVIVSGIQAEVAKAGERPASTGRR